MLAFPLPLGVFITLVCLLSEQHIAVFPKCFTELAEFSEIIFVISVKELEHSTSCVRDQDATTVSARQDLQIEPNSLNSLNSMKVLLH